MKTKIWMVNVYNDTIRNWWYSWKYLNLAIMKLAWFLLRKWIDSDRIKILTSDYNSDTKDIVDKLAKQIEQYWLDYLWFSTYMWNSKKVIEIVTQLIDINDRIKIILWWPEVTNLKWVENGNVIKVIWRWEEQLINILESKNNPLIVNWVISGIWEKKYDDVWENYGLLYSEELLATWVDFTDFDNKFWFYETSTGCFFNCGFCTYDVEKNWVNIKTTQEVIVELNNIKRLWIKKLFVIDPIFWSKKNRWKEFMRLFNEIIPEVELIMFLRAEFLDDEYIDILSQANIVDMKIWIQSLNPNIPDWLRSNNLELVSRYLPRLSKAWVAWRAELIVWLIWDTMEWLRETYKTVINEFNPTFFYWYHLNIPENTSLMKYKDRVDQPSWIKWDINWNAISSSSYTEEEMKEMLLFSMMITSLYRAIKRDNHNINITFEQLELIINNFWWYYDKSLINFFKKANHEEAEDFWKSKLDKIYQMIVNNN